MGGCIDSGGSAAGWHRSSLQRYALDDTFAGMEPTPPADHELLIDITEDPSDHFPVCLDIFAEHDSGQLFRPTSMKEWREAATCIRPGQLLIPGSLELTGELGMGDLREMGEERTPYSLIVAGDLRVEGHLALSCAIYVGGTITTESVYHNNDCHHLLATSVRASHYLYSEYPGGHVLVKESIQAPLIFFSCVAWECPITEAKILHEDFPGAQDWSAWKELLCTGGFDRAALEAVHDRDELADCEDDELTEFVEGWLRAADLGSW